MEDVGAWSFPSQEAPIELGLFRRFHASCSAGSAIYVFGGETKITAPSNKKGSIKRLLNDLLLFEPELDRWTVLHDGEEDAPSRRKGVKLVACPWINSLYLFGGAGPGTYFNDLWRFDLAERQWHNESTKCLVRSQWRQQQRLLGNVSDGEGDDVPYPAPRAYHALQVHDGKLLLYGGYGITLDSEMLWEYDLTKHSWRSILMVGSATSNAYPGVRFGLVSCIHENGFYICTGQLNNRLVQPTLWRFDLNTEVWQQIATTGAPPSPRTYSASILLKNGRWLLHGGSSADCVFSDTYELDLNSLHWHPSVSLCTGFTLEGHTIDSITTSWGVTALFLMGGATSGPVVPAGPIARCNLYLQNVALASNSDLKIEDFCVRVTYANDMIWALQQDKLVAAQTVENLKSELSSLQTENHRLRKQLLRAPSLGRLAMLKTSLTTTLATLQSSCGEYPLETSPRGEDDDWENELSEPDGRRLVEQLSNLVEFLAGLTPRVTSRIQAAVSRSEQNAAAESAVSAATRELPMAARPRSPMPQPVPAYMGTSAPPPLIPNDSPAAHLSLTADPDSSGKPAVHTITRAVACGAGLLRLTNPPKSR